MHVGQTQLCLLISLRFSGLETLVLPAATAAAQDVSGLYMAVWRSCQQPQGLDVGAGNRITVFRSEDQNGVVLDQDGKHGLNQMGGRGGHGGG